MRAGSLGIIVQELVFMVTSAVDTQLEIIVDQCADWLVFQRANILVPPLEQGGRLRDWWNVLAFRAVADDVERLLGVSTLPESSIILSLIRG